MPEDYHISTDPARLDLEFIHEFLRGSYWARDIPRDVVERSIRHSLCCGAYQGERQVGFARAVTDRATFVYVADVFVTAAHRGKGISKQLMRVLLDHPDLKGVRRLLLATKDAHGLYAQFGFQALTNPEHFMTIHRPDIYRSGSS
jgi:GNAT superfamily N-acetyltransferase